MSSKKTNATQKPNTAKPKNTEKPQEKKTKIPSINAKIDRFVDYEDSKVKAFASANIGDAFAIHGIKVMDGGEKGLYVSMPTRSYQKDGNTAYSEVFHPISTEARTELSKAVMNAYEQELAQVESEDEAMEMDEEVPFEQKQ